MKQWFKWNVIIFSFTWHQHTCALALIFHNRNDTKWYTSCLACWLYYATVHLLVYILTAQQCNHVLCSIDTVYGVHTAIRWSIGHATSAVRSCFTEILLSLLLRRTFDGSKSFMTHFPMWKISLLLPARPADSLRFIFRVCCPRCVATSNSVTVSHACVSVYVCGLSFLHRNDIECGAYHHFVLCTRHGVKFTESEVGFIFRFDLLEIEFLRANPSGRWQQLNAEKIFEFTFFFL